MNLDDALAQFDAAETTLRRLETVWERLSALVPDGISFVVDSPEGIEHENLRRAFRDLAEGLPAVGGWTIADFPAALNEIAQARLDAREIGFVEAAVSVEEGVAAPGEAVREYRFRFNRVRRQLVRERVQELVEEIDTFLATLTTRIEPDREAIADPEWPRLVDAIREVERLIGSSTSRKGRWRDLARHLEWGQGVDLRDIAEHDWPSVLADIQAGLYTDFEPVPVQVADLGELASTRPQGRVSTALMWERLDEEGFERLLFNIISDTPGYENPKWLTRTRAPDRGRDLSVDRVYEDALSGVRRQRVIIQCKHWLSKSIGPRDVADALASVKLCEPPPVDALVLASSGRFTSDAVTWIDRHNHERDRPPVETWPESHLESLLAQKPHLVAQSGLRGI